MNMLLLLTTLTLASPADRQTVVVVVGVAGKEKYEAQFKTWTDRWAAVAKKAGAKLVRVGQTDDKEALDANRLRQLLSEEPKDSKEPLWLVLIGHGTYDGHEAKFNVRRPDFSAAELANWLQPFKRPLAVINCASSSGPFINHLSSAGRVVVTATKSGFEQDFTRFGDYLSASIADPEADLDKDDQTSLLEAYLFASARVTEFYDQESRLSTEHALLDDNGDGLGTPATWFRGVRATRTAKQDAEIDGLKANQFHLIRSQPESLMPTEVRARRDQLELDIAKLRETKRDSNEDDYYEKLRTLLLQLARLYEELDKSQPEVE